jgi:F-type H+/Na+-transporting ATPase subunit alpha
LYREMEAFSKFGGDLDPATELVLDKGARNVEILKQAQYAPYSVEKQVAIIYLGTQGLLREVPVRRVKEFEEQFLMELENKHPEVLASFKKGNLPDDGIKSMVELAKGIIPHFKS